MSGSVGGARDRRQRRGRQQPGPSDAIVTALTAQVLVCILLLLAATTMKRVDEARYTKVKAEYNTLVSDGEEAARAFSYLRGLGGAAQLFSTLEHWIDSLISQFVGEPVVQGPTDPDPEEEPVQEADQFDFGYLAGSGSAELYQLGAGGAFAVEGSSGAAMAAPEGATLAPVVLGAKLIPPVSGVITSDFAYRYHPVNGESDFHTGMDIAALEGTGILSALPGEVVETGWSDVYGNYVVLQHAINLRTFYAHCSEIIAQEGMAVREGQRIARVGQTGVATGPHLHFGVIVEGQYTDPAWVLGDSIELVE